MSNTLGTYPLGEWIQNLKTRLKDFDDQTIPPGLWVSIINSVVGEFHELAETKDKAEYKDRVVLSLNSGYSLLKAEGSANDSYVQATRLLTLLASECVYATGHEADYTNGILINFKDSGVGFMYNIKALNTAPGTNFVFELIEDPLSVDVDFVTDMQAGDSGFAIASKTGTADNIDISGLGIYKYIDQITMINDTVRGTCEAVTEAKFRSIANPVYANPNYKTKIIYFRDGEYLRFDKGASVTTYGTRTMYFTRTPYKSDVDTLTDFVDVKDTNKKLIEDLCLLSGLQTLKVPIPSELKSAESRIDKMRARKESEIAKLVADSPS